MKSILILGAGMSSSSLIKYLLSNAKKYDWNVKVVDQDIELVKRKINNHERGEALAFNAIDSEERKIRIAKADLVISMLPARYHVEVAQDCIDLKVDLITPSYISKEMQALDEAARKAGIVIMNEIGVDPGIDHMSAMKIIHAIQKKGGELLSFKSFCGGLIAPKYDTNPWHYKFTWNPRNVVLAGQGGLACFIEKNEYKYLPYNRLFQKIDRIKIHKFGAFEGYANRDALRYRKTYGIDEIPTIYRGTLRRPNFCQGWDVFIELGMTDDQTRIENSHLLSPRTFLNAFLPYKAKVSVEEKFKLFLRPERHYLFEQFEWLGLFESKVCFEKTNASPAELLEELLVKKLNLEPGDKDMLVMYHKFKYRLNGVKYQIESSMVNLGEDQIYTSMSNTVGLPVGIAAKMILSGNLHEKGVTLPINKEVYEPILNELKSYGIEFTESEKIINII